MSATTETDEDLTVDAELVGKPCSYCGKPCEGHFAIHRDGFCVGPEVPLCDEHGGSEEPTVEAIWTRLAMLRAATMTDPPMAGVLNGAPVPQFEAQELKPGGWFEVVDPSPGTVMHTTIAGRGAVARLRGKQ